MFTQQKPSIARALRRNYTMLSPPTSSPASSSSSPPQRAWIHLRSVFLVIASSPVTDDRGSLKSPWSRRRRKHALLPKQWNSLFDADGRFCDGGVKFLKKVRSGGVDPTLRAEVWPFLLGIYELNSSKEERASIRTQKREEYDKLRDECVHVSKRTGMSSTSGAKSNISEESGELSQVMDPPSPEEVNNDECTASSLYKEHKDAVLPDCSPTRKDSDKLSAEEVDESEITTENASDSDSSDFGNDQNNLENDNKEKSQSPELGTTPKFSAEKVGESEITTENASDSDFSDIGNDQTNLKNDNKEKSPSPELGTTQKSLDHEEFSTWQRIIRLDAVRANAEWVNYSPSQSSVSETKARELADSVGLKDYDHLEPCRIFHAARLVAILEAYTLYDPEIGYCQGMSDLLSPIISVIEDDFEAFWCFVGFMRKARHNFRLDEVGIRKQLSMVSKIIKYKDSHLYSHLEKLEAQDCFFVYRMVVVLFRRELNLEQIYCLWEVMWADQASIRANIGKSDFGRMRVRAPPSDDLLLYAIAACVLQRRKIIIENFSSMDEIMRECNGMAGRLDVWKLLDDAHDLVVNLHNKI